MADSCSAEAEVSPRLTFYDLEEVAFYYQGWGAAVLCGHIYIHEGHHV